MLVTVSLSYNAHSSGNRHDPSWTSVKAESLCSDHRAAVEVSSSLVTGQHRRRKHPLHSPELKKQSNHSHFNVLEVIRAL